MTPTIDKKGLLTAVFSDEYTPDRTICFAYDLLDDPKALPFGTRLRTTQLKNNSPNCFFTFRAFSRFDSFFSIIFIKKDRLRRSFFDEYTPDRTICFAYDLLDDPKALPFGTRLRTTQLKNNSPNCFFTFRAFSRFDSFFSIIFIKKDRLRRSFFDEYTPDRSRTCDNPASEAGALSTELRAHIYRAV